jgi:hypothetical protein
VIPCRRPGARGAAVALALTLGLGACGSDGCIATDASGGRRAADGPASEISTTPPRPAHLCRLLQPTEIEAAFGGPVSTGHESPARCEWDVLNPASPGSVNVTWVNTTMRTPARDEFVHWKDDISGGSVPVAGLGDEAFLGRDLVLFRDGDLLMWVQAAFVPTVPGTHEKVTALARLVERRL